MEWLILTSDHTTRQAQVVGHQKLGGFVPTSIWKRCKSQQPTKDVVLQDIHTLHAGRFVHLIITAWLHWNPLQIHQMRLFKASYPVVGAQVVYLLLEHGNPEILAHILDDI